VIVVVAVSISCKIYMYYSGIERGIVVHTVFESVHRVAFDINGTLIGGRYYRWEWIFEEGLGLKKREDAPPLKWYEVQAGRLSFEDTVSLTYVVEDPKTLREEAFRVYLAHLELREGCVELLENLRRMYELVICSDTSGVTKMIAKHFDLEKYFSKFFYSIDIGWLKSDREFWVTFLSSFPDARPDEFAMVGDNTRCDIHWPNVFGMGTIQVETTEMLSVHSLEVLDEYDQPNLYVRNLDEISRFLSRQG
jgi:FMN phosphatase YigB (HAD superfamily)